ncbi:MAG: hypothetical protein HZB10_01345 [Candidatus Yonathbacteria bacterium]|nr:hypothetical protein [Candidatus Yonathbacteria bacterium]
MKHVTALVKKAEKGEQFTKDDLVFLYEIDSKIKGFGYKKDPRIVELRKMRNPREDASIVLDCTPDQIATTQAEITENTKAYIGPLFPGIFKRDLEHIYTSFPEGKIKKTEMTVHPLLKEEALEAYRKSGGDTWIWPELEKNMPYTTPKEDVLDVFLLGFGKSVSSDDALAEMDRLGVRPLTYEELIQYGIVDPESQKKNTLVALGSKHSLRGGPRAPTLDVGGDKRCLGANFWDDGWYDRYRFPVVRK